jgi:hypothetical protein
MINEIKAVSTLSAKIVVATIGGTIGGVAGTTYGAVVGAITGGRLGTKAGCEMALSIGWPNDRRPTAIKSLLLELKNIGQTVADEMDISE